MSNHKRLYGAIAKVETLEDGTLTVWGYASTQSVDADGETITAEAMKAALPDYLRFGAVREMHQPKAAGTAIEAEVRADGRTWFGAHIVDSEAVKKIKAGVYKGFSIGGKVTRRSNRDDSIITGLKLVEVSLVDRPANPEAIFTCYKAADATPHNRAHSARAPQSHDDEMEEPMPEENASRTEAIRAALRAAHAACQAADEALAELGIDPDAEDDLNDDEDKDEEACADPRERKRRPRPQASDEDDPDAEDRDDDPEADPEEARDTAPDQDTDSEDPDAEDQDDPRATRRRKPGAQREAADARSPRSAKPRGASRKVAQGDSLRKACQAAGCRADEHPADFIRKLAAERKALLKRVRTLEAQPEPGKGVLKMLSKGEEMGADLRLSPVVDHAGSINEAATLIKFLHQHGHQSI